MGTLRQHGSLRLSKYADLGVRRRRAHLVSRRRYIIIIFFFLSRKDHGDLMLNFFLLQVRTNEQVCRLQGELDDTSVGDPRQPRRQLTFLGQHACAPRLPRRLQDDGLHRSALLSRAQISKKKHKG